jgi:predicted O-methyltransferase YrrM
MATNGMLPIEVYEKIFNIGRDSAGGTMIEIGTYRGSATIALALGAKECGKPFHIYTTDLFSGKYSSLVQFGDVNENMRIVRTHYEKFDVDNFITVVAGGCKEILSQYPVRNINVLVLDADGRIDRDLALLFDRLSDGCIIIIDDIDNAAHLRRFNASLLLDQKHRLSYLLTQRLLADGLLVQTDKIHDTGFYVKGSASITAESILLNSLSAYRELVFCDITDVPHPDRKRLTQRTRQWVSTNVPLARLAYRKMKSLLH